MDKKPCTTEDVVGIALAVNVAWFVVKLVVAWAMCAGGAYLPGICRAVSP